MDLTRILHEGDKLYSPIVGNVTVHKIIKNTSYPIVTQPEEGGGFVSFSSEGKYTSNKDAECLLFPKRDSVWTSSEIYKFLKPRPGDILKSKNNAIFIFSKYEDGMYKGKGIYNRDLFCSVDLNIPQEQILGRATDDEIGYFKESLKDFGTCIDELRRKMDLNCILRQPEYYCITSELIVGKTTDLYCNVDNNRYRCGNYFQTKEKAEEILNEIKPIFEKHKYERSY